VAALTLLWMAAAAGWWWLQRRWSEYQHGDRCACGLFGLEDIHAQHTEVAVHERGRCFPIRERV
jgi:hypothetical protein